MKIVIIGGGASGMMAAIAASEDPENEIWLLERQAKVGRKLLATGNGRCNLTNLHADVSHYHGEVPAFAENALEHFGVEATLEQFQKLGLLTVMEASGRYYPYSDQANSVVDVLRFALERENVHILCGCEVRKVLRSAAGFTVQTEGQALECQRVILACGGLAGSKLGGSMSGYKLLRSLGHHCTRLRPALVQLRSSYPRCASLKGIRANCIASVYKDDTLFSHSQGEVQFTEFGLSGPVIFEVSRDACAESGVWQCQLDLLPQLTEDDLTSLLAQRRALRQSADNLFTGILHNRLGRVLTQEAGISLTTPIEQLRDSDFARAANLAKHFTLALTEPLGMDSAQVTAGGILVSEFDPVTMESRLVPGLYACGEVLDIDGDCGGYNLQWAWSSGHLAGVSAGRKT